MSNLNGKNVIIGVSGGIAAYKTADLVRRIKEVGADVRVVMTKAATDFVTPLTFQALSGHPVSFDNDDQSASSGMQHIELARWVDVILVAPASANTIAKLTQGRADNLLTTLCLASEAIKCFAPAMNRVMWDDKSTQHNCSTLTDKGWQQFGPDSGSQACGETGEGRMMAVPELVNRLEQCFHSGTLRGLNLVVTAGPTYEAIDPVRFIGNRSSGKMGYAIAQAAKEAGANVTLISGPTHLQPPEVTLVSIETTEELKQAVLDVIHDCQIYISAAAVSDYRVDNIAEQKIKKSDDSMQLKLVKNDDIVSLVARHTSRPYVVGFAAETENLKANAKLKLVRKNLDMIVANDVGSNAETDQPDIGFNSDYNALYIIWRNDITTSEPVIEQQQFDINRKSRLARQLISLIAQSYLDSQHNNKKDTA